MSFNVDNETYQELQTLLKVACSDVAYSAGMALLAKFEPVAPIDYLHPADSAWEGFKWKETDPLKVSEQLEALLAGDENSDWFDAMPVRKLEVSEELYLYALQKGWIVEEEGEVNEHE